MNVLLSSTLGAAVALAFATAAQAVPVVYAAGGSDASAIQATVDAFRDALGPLNPNVAGSAAGGRREINWDGVPNGAAAPNPMPGNLFNTTSPRGVVLSTPGSGLQVSANGSGGAAVGFGNVNPTYPGLFAPFSAPRMLTALGSNVIDVGFFVPGSTTPASVSAFGAVFTDVDLAATSGLQFFAPDGTLLASVFAPPAPGDETLSFVGLRFTGGERIGRVRIVAGNAALGGNDTPTVDHVVLDDFIYAEPVVAVVPEPPPAALAAAGLALLAAWRRRSARTGSTAPRTA